MTEDNTITITFEEYTAHRRAALRLLHNIVDEEATSPSIILSKLKSSRRISIQSNLICKLSGNDNSVGYCICRTCRGLKSPGKYYWEVEFLRSKSGEGHCRCGISSIEAKLDAPCGYDQYGYCLRDKGGSFHCAQRSDGPQYNIGDLIGFGLIIPEEKDQATLCCWINGENQTTLFEHIKTDTEWFPTVCPYRDAQIRTQFYEPFKHFPGDDWMPAGEHPNITPKGNHTIDELIKVMKSGKIADMTEDLILAMNDVMAPPEELQN